MGPKTEVGQSSWLAWTKPRARETQPGSARSLGVPSTQEQCPGSFHPKGVPAYLSAGVVYLHLDIRPGRTLS